MQPEANQFHRFHFPEMHLRGEAYQLKDQGHDEAATDMEAAADALLGLQAATPAPASDEVLAELAELEKQATPAPWTAWQGQGKVFYGKPEINTPGHYSPANIELFSAHDFDREEEDMDVQPGTAEDDAAYIAALRNAAPALLARVRAAEAFKAQLVELLATRRDAAHKLFTEELEENGAEGPIAGAEAADEISKIARALGLTLPEAVKGGQPHA